MARQIVDDPVEGSQMFDAHDGIPAQLHFSLAGRAVVFKRRSVITLRTDHASSHVQAIINGLFEALTGQSYTGPSICNKIAYLVKDSEDMVTVMWAYDDRILGIAEYEYCAG